MFAETTDYFGVKPSALTIAGADKGTLRTIYKTIYRGTLYNCQICYGEVRGIRMGFLYPHPT